MIRVIQFCIAVIAILFFHLYVYENLPWVDDIERYKVNFQYPIVYALNSNLTTPVWGVIVLLLLEVLDISIEDTITVLQYAIFVLLTFTLSFASKNLFFTLLLLSSLFVTYSLDMVIGNLRQGIATCIFIFSLLYFRGLKQFIGLTLSVLTHNMMVVPWYIFYIDKIKISNRLSKNIEQVIFVMPLVLLIVLFGSSVSTAEDGSRSIFGLITYASIFILFFGVDSSNNLFKFARGMLFFISSTYMFFDQSLRYMGSFISVVIIALKEMSKENQVLIVSILILSSIFLWVLRLGII